jgi:hypothetical protein
MLQCRHGVERCPVQDSDFGRVDWMRPRILVLSILSPECVSHHGDQFCIGNGRNLFRPLAEACKDSSDDETISGL